MAAADTTSKLDRARWFPAVTARDEDQQQTHLKATASTPSFHSWVALSASPAALEQFHFVELHKVRSPPRQLHHPKSHLQTQSPQTLCTSQPPPPQRNECKRDSQYSWPIVTALGLIVRICTRLNSGPSAPLSCRSPSAQARQWRAEVLPLRCVGWGGRWGCGRLGWLAGPWGCHGFITRLVNRRDLDAKPNSPPHTPAPHSLPDQHQPVAHHHHLVKLGRLGLIHDETAATDIYKSK